MLCVIGDRCWQLPGEHNRLFYLSAALTYAAGLLEVDALTPHPVLIAGFESTNSALGVRH